MKKKFIHTLLFILAVLFMIHTATLYAQVSVVRKEKGFEVKDSLIVNQSFDRERKVLTLEIKNEFNYKIMLSNPYSSPLFLLNYITEEGKCVERSSLVCKNSVGICAGNLQNRYSYCTSGYGVLFYLYGIDAYGSWFWSRGNCYAACGRSD